MTWSSIISQSNWMETTGIFLFFYRHKLRGFGRSIRMYLERMRHTHKMVRYIAKWCMALSIRHKFPEHTKIENRTIYYKLTRLKLCFWFGLLMWMGFAYLQCIQFGQQTFGLRTWNGCFHHWLIVLFDIQAALASIYCITRLIGRGTTKIVRLHDQKKNPFYELLQWNIFEKNTYVIDTGSA